MSDPNRRHARPNRNGEVFCSDGLCMRACPTVRTSKPQKLTSEPFGHSVRPIAARRMWKLLNANDISCLVVRPSSIISITGSPHPSTTDTSTESENHGMHSLHSFGFVGVIPEKPDSSKSEYAACTTFGCDDQDIRRGQACSKCGVVRPENDD